MRLLGHLSPQDLTEVTRFLDQMRGAEDIAAVAAQEFERVEEQETW
jgi:hypothetical protein